MVKVKIFSQYKESKLEEQLNEFVNELQRKDIIDIKFNASSTKGHDDGELFTALVIYEG
ncbi:sporulation protein Cse60 [Paenibacillus sp. FSL R10-2771]|uniref:sporulation protein Cse60 n=1 Tax=Paenibacillus sp. FSL R10-2771 TaxID=2954693 RepID=UPI0030FCAF1D